MGKRLEDYGEVLTPMQAKEILCVGRNAIYDMLKTKRIQSFRVGKKILIPKICVENFLNNAAVPQQA